MENTRIENYYDLLHLILPRYIRISKNSNHLKNTILSKIKEKFQLHENITVIKWLPNFIVVPGYLSMSQINQLLEEEQLESQHQLHCFPIDIASAIPSFILSKLHYQTYLDLCCSPGGKLICLSDWTTHSHPITAVGVDISKKRLETCRSLVSTYFQSLYHNYHDSNTHKDNISEGYPHVMLFCSDGTRFACQSSSTSSSTAETTIGELIYDSTVDLEDISHAQINGRKRQNKSSRGRSQKKLKQIQSTLIRDDSQEEDSKDDLIADETKKVCSLNEFDIVLVDAQCTHDGSYRHLRYLSSPQSPQLESPSEAQLEPQSESKEVELPFSKIRKSHPSLLISNDENNTIEREELKQLQRGLIRNGFDRLKKGCRMIYSTCSFQEEQNEQIVQWLLDEINNTTISTSTSAKVVPLNEWSNPSQFNLNDLQSFHPLVQTILTSSDETLFQELSSLYQNSPNDFKTLSNDVCRFVSNFILPPGREGSIPGTVCYGRWAGTSGLFMACIEKS